MGTGFGFLGFGLVLAAASRPIARLLLRMRGLGGLEATEPVIYRTFQGTYRWTFVFLGACSVIYGVLAIVSGSRV